MEKILRWMNFLLNCFINTCLLFALFIVAMYFIWGVTPQTVVERGGYFFSESWKIITGRTGPEEPVPVVSEKQLKEAEPHVYHLNQ